MVRSIEDVYYGCERLMLDPTSDPATPTWRGRNITRKQPATKGKPPVDATPSVTAEFNTKTDKLKIIRNGRFIEVDIPQGAVLDIYIPPAEEGLGYTMAPAASNKIERHVQQQCGYLPGHQGRKVPGSKHEMRGIVALTRAHGTSGDKDALASWVRRTWAKNPQAVRSKIRTRVGERPWLTMVAKQMARAARLTGATSVKVGVVYDQGKPMIVSSAKVSATLRKSYGNMLGQFAERSGTGGGMISYAKDADDCFLLRQGAGGGSVCQQTFDMLARKFVSVIVPGPEGHSQVHTKAMREHVDKNLAMYQEALEIMDGKTSASGVFRAAPVERIIYNECEDLTQIRNGAAIRQWTHPTGDVVVRPGAETNTLIAVRKNVASIIRLPDNKPVILYLDKSLVVDLAKHKFPAAPTDELDPLQTLMDRKHQCDLPLTVHEKAMKQRYVYLPDYSFGISWSFGWHDDLSLVVDPPEDDESKTLGRVRAALGVPEDNLTGTLSALDVDVSSIRTFGALAIFEKSIFRTESVQLFAGAEVSYMRFLGTNAINLTQYMDINGRFGLRHAVMAVGDFMFLPGFSVGTGLSAPFKSSGWFGGNFSAELALLRVVQPKWFTEFFGRFEWHQFAGMVDGLDARATVNATGTIGARVGWHSGAPPPPPPKTEHFTVMTGEMLMTPTVFFADSQPTRATTNRILAMNDLASIMRIPVLRTVGSIPRIRPTPGGKDQKLPFPSKVFDALKIIARQLRRIPKDYRIQIIGAVDTSESSGVSPAEHRARGENAARIVRHVLMLMGIPAEQLVIAPWSSRKLRHQLSPYKHDDLMRLKGVDNTILFSILRTTEY